MKRSTPYSPSNARARAMLAALVLTALCLPASPAAAGDKVDMRGAISSTNGPVEASIKGLGSVAFDTSVFVSFDESERVVTAEDSQGIFYNGKYKRKGDGGRKLVIELDKDSKKGLKKTMKQIIKQETGASKVKFGFDKLVVLMKVNKALDKLKVKIKAEFSGEADGERGEGTYLLKTDGPLVFPTVPPL